MSRLHCSARFLSSGYIAVFILPSTWAFYLTSVLIGIGAASKSLCHQCPFNIRQESLFTFGYLSCLFLQGCNQLLVTLLFIRNVYRMPENRENAHYFLVLSHQHSSTHYHVRRGKTANPHISEVETRKLNQSIISRFSSSLQFNCMPFV